MTDKRDFLTGLAATLGAGAAVSSQLAFSSGPGSGSGWNRVTDFGAVGDGVANDTMAFKKALANTPGGILLVPNPLQSYRVNELLVVPAGTSLVGESRLGSKIVSESPSALFQLEDHASLMNLFLDGGRGKGMGIQIRGSAGQQRIENCRVSDFEGPCLYFDATAGSGFSCLSSLMYRRKSPPGSKRWAVMIHDVRQLNAVPRKFTHFETGGQCSFHLGGGNNTYISNSFLSDLDFSRNSAATLIANCRIATSSPLQIQGGQNCITGCDVFPTVTLMPGSGGCVIGPNAYNNPPVTDLSGNSTNSVHFTEQPYQAQVTSSAGSLVAGDAGISAFWSRQGHTVQGRIHVRIGAKSRLGPGLLKFSLPHRTSCTSDQVCGTLLARGRHESISATLVLPAKMAHLEAQTYIRQGRETVLPTEWWLEGTMDLNFSYGA